MTIKEDFFFEVSAPRSARGTGPPTHPTTGHANEYLPHKLTDFPGIKRVPIDLVEVAMCKTCCAFTLHGILRAECYHVRPTGALAEITA